MVSHSFRSAASAPGSPAMSMRAAGRADFLNPCSRAKPNMLVPAMNSWLIRSATPAMHTTMIMATSASAKTTAVTAQ